MSILKKKNWTKKLYEYYSKLIDETNLNHDVDVNQIRVDVDTRTRNFPRQITFNDYDRRAEISIEGPFSTCTSYIFDCEHVVLIGAGIGITPYISALESLIIQLRERRCDCRHCGATNYNELLIARQKLKKIDFIWVNREVGNVSWFRSILDEFEKEQESYLAARTVPQGQTSEQERMRYLDIHLYCTSVKSNDQAMLDNAAYDLIANMYNVLQNKDMLTSLRTPTRFGRPPWKLLFAKFKAEHRTTGIFFTGNQAMGEELQRYCDQYKFNFQHEPYF